jgi:hypothetical protein
MRKEKSRHKPATLILAKIEKVEENEKVSTLDLMIKEWSERYRESITKPLNCPYIISKI